MNRSKLGGKFDAQTIRHDKVSGLYLVESLWTVEHLRRKAKGPALYEWQRVVPPDTTRNVCTDEGLNALLDIMFHGASQITSWYVLIFESDTTPDGDTTYAVPVFTESTAYDEATRPAYGGAAASNKVMTNSASKATFTMNATKTIYGGALVGGGSAPSTKGDVAGGGTLYCASKFGTAKSVVDDDVLKVTVTITAADT
jgi:hypothetical protein